MGRRFFCNNEVNMTALSVISDVLPFIVIMLSEHRLAGEGWHADIASYLKFVRA